ncbi:hypothetical protein EDD29_8155 [Actinocorallia herbida]|uniref:Uncharacterized protein n=1 Tax=Actinocorallia herbida TaxID=58109 RepID=A0A3N1DAA2_9ACTN|nr:hypothetical protein [Actinocorallia herbida]ROO90430.1 hypothetical protein EDD29_8155 [Actinocorallia herbida]
MADLIAHVQVPTPQELAVTVTLFLLVGRALLGLVRAALRAATVFVFLVGLLTVAGWLIG